MNNINKIIKGVSLLTDINLALESGHIYGFVGDNGSGKTVLFKVLLGLMHKTSGTILVDGREQKDLMQDVGFIIERPAEIYSKPGRGLHVTGEAVWLRQC